MKGDKNEKSFNFFTAVADATGTLKHWPLLKVRGNFKRNNPH